MEKNDGCKKDVEIIMPYLKSKGYDFSIKHKQDRIRYYVAKNGDIRYLAFEVVRADAKPWEEIVVCHRTETAAQIVYDTKGNVLLDCIDHQSTNHGRFRDDRITVAYVELKPGYIFWEDFVLIDHGSSIRELKYSVYKLENGTYSLVGQPEQYSGNIIEAANGELFVNGSGRLYSIRSGQYLNNLKFDEIIGVEHSQRGFPGGSYGKLQIKHLEDPNIIDAIHDTIQNTNCLFAQKHIVSTEVLERQLFHNEYKDATAFAFLDTAGNITGKVYFKNEFEFYAVDADNDTYEQIIEAFREKLDDDVRREVALRIQKREAEQRLRNETCNQVVELLSSISTLASEKTKELTKSEIIPQSSSNI